MVYRLKSSLFLGLGLLLACFYPITTYGKDKLSPHDDEIYVLVIYSTETGDVDAQQRLLDMLVGHFTQNIEFKHTSEVKPEDLSRITHLFYYGEILEQLSTECLNAIEQFQGKILAIGNNIEQLHSVFSFIRSTVQMQGSDLFISNRHGKQINVDYLEFIQTTPEGRFDTLIEVTHNGTSDPLLIRQGKAYYLTTANLFPPISTFLAEELHSFFDTEHEKSNQAFLRLEDIHPGTDWKLLHDIAEILNARNIPYMVSVTPVYVNRETDEEYHLSDNTDLVDTLVYMQDHGASLILHGYTDQFDTNQTGDGFEFWDKDRNAPIYEAAHFDKSSNGDETKTSFEKIEFETEYITNRMKNGFNALMDYKLYPIAVEVPHYAISQNGYRILARHFSTYVGQVQLTDNDWKNMVEAPYTTTPSFLNGMQLLPETIRYVRYNDSQSLQEISERIHEFSIVRDGVIGGFYHPFLGTKGLIDLISEMEKISDIRWIDLRQFNNKVIMDGITIKTDQGGFIVENSKERDVTIKEGRSIIYLTVISLQNTFWMFVGAALTGSLILGVYVRIRAKRSLH